MKAIFTAALAINLSVASYTLAQQQPVDANALALQHNMARQNVVPSALPLIPDLTWDGDLATSAAAFAAQCTLGHSGTPGVGENIFYSSSTTLVSPDAVVNSWVSEKQFYDVQTSTCARGKICGHYTQVVWADTTFVGCGAALCDPKINGDWGQKWVCQYKAPGNVVGQAPYVPDLGDDPLVALVPLDLFCDHVHKWGAEFTIGSVLAPHNVNTCQRPPLGSNVPGTVLTVGVFCDHLHLYGGNNTTYQADPASVEVCASPNDRSNAITKIIFCKHLHDYAGSPTSWPYSNDDPDAYQPPWIDLWSEEGFCYDAGG